MVRQQQQCVFVTCHFTISLPVCYLLHLARDEASAAVQSPAVAVTLCVWWYHTVLLRHACRRVRLQHLMCCGWGVQCHPCVVRLLLLLL
jgi:poly-beta-hydroxyalkanoate depolymerase